jgi:lipoate-protein ligase A
VTSPSPDVRLYGLDDDLILSAIEKQAPQMRVYRVGEAMVVLGRSSKPEVELNVDACIEDGIAVYRRHGGGCSVVQDSGNVIVSIAMPAEGVGDIRRWLTSFTEWLIEGLEQSGVNGVYRDGTSDLVIGDRKVAGSCMYRRKGMVFFSASILVRPDIGLMEKYLRHPPREPKYRMGRSHKDFVGTLESLAGVGDIESFEAEMKIVLGTLVPRTIFRVSGTGPG